MCLQCNPIHCALFCGKSVTELQGNFDYVHGQHLFATTDNALPGADGLSLPPLPAVLTEKRGIFLSAAAALCREDDN